MRVFEDVEELGPNPEQSPFPMRDLEVLRYRQVRVEVARPGELVAALLAEAVYSGAEIGSEQAGCSRISGARSACLTSSSREARWYGDRRNVREAVVETLQNAERVGINDCKRQPSACEGRARKYPSPSNALGPNLWGTL